MCWGRNKVCNAVQILSVFSVLPQGVGTQRLPERLCFNHSPAFPSSLQPQPLRSILHSCLGSLEIAAVNTDPGLPGSTRPDCSAQTPPGHSLPFPRTCRASPQCLTRRAGSGGRGCRGWHRPAAGAVGSCSPHPWWGELRASARVLPHGVLRRRVGQAVE